jgi:hypothetical protein
MTWFAWRVQRLQFLVALAAVLAFAVWLVVVGLHEQARWTYFTLRGCTTSRRYGLLGGGACDGFRPYDWTHWNGYFLGLLYAIPALIGLLLGSPLVAQEIERGTNRFAWTQSITRTRWLAIKVLVAGFFTTVIAAGLIALARWWLHAVRISYVGGHAPIRDYIAPTNFDVDGPVVIGYALFAFMLGVALGAVFRRTGWALLVGVPVFVLFRIVVHRYLLTDLMYPRIHQPTVSALQGAETAVFAGGALFLFGMAFFVVRRWCT